MLYDDEALLKRWIFRPAHLFRPNSKYIITGSTHNKWRFFDSDQKKTMVQEVLFEQCARFSWVLEAWAIFSNHYHFIAESPEDSKTLVKLMQGFHSKTSMLANRMDDKRGRKIWYQYWDTCITHENSYFARLKYVNENPQKHLLVEDAADYPWCSMQYLLQSDAASVDKILNMKTDKLSIQDDF